MSDRNHSPSNESTRPGPGFERRPLLKALGVGTALSLGVGTAAASEHGSQDETASDDHFVEDLVDPTFGYPLAADETDDLDLEHTVEMSTVEGPGSHENFPQGPPQEGEEEDGETEADEGGEGFPFEFEFDPAGLRVEPDDLVHFRSTAGEHTATAFHEKYSNPELAIPTRIPDGVPGFTSPPIVDGESWVYQFSTPGVYDVLCLPHLFFGMVMRIVVIDTDEHDLEDETFAEPSAGEIPPNVERVLTADELDPANIVERGTVAWGDLTLEGGSGDGGAGDGGTGGGENETG